MSAWSDDEKKLVDQLWRDGYSASQIAMELGRAGYEGRSRNAVIGVAHRAGLTHTERKAAPPPRPKPSKPKIKAPAVAPLPPAQPAVEETRPVSRAPDRPGISIGDLDGLMLRCRYPLWDDDAKLPVEEQMYCGDAVRIGRSYCPYHCSIAYAPPAERRRAA